MPAYTIKAPDGSEYDVEGPGTADQALAHFKKTWVDPRTSDYSNEGRSRPESSEALKPMSERISTGIGGAIKGLTRDVGNMLGDLPGVKLANIATNNVVPDKLESEVQKYENVKPYIGTAGHVADTATEVAATLAPIMKAGNVLAKTRAAQRLGKGAVAAGDIAANAGYSGGKAIVEGKDAGDVVSDTLWGAGGAAVPHALIGGVKAGVGLAKEATRRSLQRGITPEARALLDEGIELTPGQMNPSLKGAEETAKYAPGAASHIVGAQTRSMEQYVTKTVNDALAPLEEGVKTTGRKAVNDAHDVVDKSFNRVVEDLYITPADLRANLVKLDENLPTYGLTDKQSAKLYKAVTSKLSPLMEAAEREGGDISGRAFKNADAHLGTLARKYAKSANPDHHPLGEAFFELQRQLRTSLSPTRLGAEQDLLKSNMAFKNLLDVKKAANREGGMFTPEQLRKVVEKEGRSSQFQRNAQEVLKKTKGSPYRTGLVPLASAAGLGGLGYYHGDVGGLLGTAALIGGARYGGGKLARKLYTEGGLSKFMTPERQTKLIGPVPKKARLPKATGTNAQRVYAQGGRMIATDDKEK